VNHGIVSQSDTEPEERRLNIVLAVREVR
jgi:hypothetical protein